MFEHGQFYWNELITPDVEKAKTFYAKILGWTFETMPMPKAITLLPSRARTWPAASCRRRRTWVARHRSGIPISPLTMSMLVRMLR